MVAGVYGGQLDPKTLPNDTNHTAFITIRANQNGSALSSFNTTASSFVHNVAHTILNNISSPTASSAHNALAPQRSHNMPMTFSDLTSAASGGTFTNTTSDDDDAMLDTCPVPEKVRYSSIIGVDLAVPQWQAILLTLVLSIIILVTIVGNILVILSVFTYKPLRIVQNFFIVSLAVADLTVAILVLPFNVANMVLGRWVFGIHLCKMWLTSDVLCCTSSILNLCAIALDRYWAITDPINYAQKRTVERVLFLIAGVWVLSLVISSPPLIGWNDWPEEFDSEMHPCALNSNPGYRVYSALGSFYIPLIIMTIVYIEIYVATRRRLRERAKAASRINAAANMRGGGGTGGTATAAAAAAIAGGPAGGIATGGGGGGGILGSVAIGVQMASSPGNGSGSGGADSGGSTARCEPLSMVVLQHDQDSISSETNHNDVAEMPHQQQQQHQPKGGGGKKEKRQRAKDSLRLDQAPRGGRAAVVAAAAAAAADVQLRVPLAPEDSCTDVAAENSSESLTITQKVPSGDGVALIAEHGAANEAAGCKDGSAPGGGGKTTGGVGFGAAGAGGAAARSATVVKKPSTVYQFIEEKQKISLSKERRAARTLGIIMGVFIACWVPFFLLYIIQPFCSWCCPSDRFIDFLTWLGYINSALNPIIYTIFNLDYRRAFKKLLGIKF